MRNEITRAIATATLAACVAACGSSSNGTGDSSGGAPPPAAGPSASAPAPAPPPAELPPPPPPATIGIGTVAGKPFIVGGAFARDDRDGTWEVWIYEDAKSTCDDVGFAGLSERSVEILMHGTWRPGTYAVGPDAPDEPLSPAFVDIYQEQANAVMASFATSGTVEVLDAQTNVGDPASLTLHGIGETMFPSSLDGTIHAVVCPPAP